MISTISGLNFFNPPFNSFLSLKLKFLHYDLLLLLIYILTLMVQIYEDPLIPSIAMALVVQLVVLSLPFFICILSLLLFNSLFLLSNRFFHLFKFIYFYYLVVLMYTLRLYFSLYFTLALWQVKQSSFLYFFFACHSGNCFV